MGQEGWFTNENKTLGEEKSQLHQGVETQKQDMFGGSRTDKGQLPQSAPESAPHSRGRQLKF